jgi:periplasmic protein TonB
MINCNSRRRLLFSGLAAGVMHMLAAAAVFYCAVYGLHKSSEITEVHLVSPEAAAGPSEPAVQRKPGPQASAAAGRIITSSVENTGQTMQAVLTEKASNNTTPAGNVAAGSQSAAGASIKRVSVETMRFGSATGPNFLRRAVPVYPVIARRMNKEGKVLLKLTIDDRGKLLNVDVIEAAGFGFTESALEAVGKSTYRPAVKNGLPAPAMAFLPVRFKLADN